MKDIFPSLIGNVRLKQTLSGNLSHAYIVEGAKGSGRMTAARNCAAAALCKSEDDSKSLPCGECSVCSRIFRGIHPDVIEFDTGSKKSIGVDTAREIRSQVFIAPVESNYKFFIVRDADLMTPEAQNALLISLEEPPEFSVFFLLVTDKALLLETIRSRCVTLNTERLQDSAVSNALLCLSEGKRLYETFPEVFNSIVKGANGSIGEGIRLITDGGKAAKELSDAASELIKVILNGSSAEKVSLSTSFPKARDTQENILTLAIYAVRDIISCKIHADTEMLFYSSPSEAASYTSHSLTGLTALYNTLEDGITALSGNASPMLTAEQIIMSKFR